MKGKHVNLMLLGTLAILYLSCMLALLLRDTYTIQSQMLRETENLAEAAAEEMLYASSELEGCTREEQFWGYQLLMADNDDGLSASYPFRCVSFLTGFDTQWHVPVRSRNMMLVTITWNDGTTEQIPIVFQYENSADVAQVLMDPASLRLSASCEYLEFTGFWLDGLFHVQKIQDWAYAPRYEIPGEVPEGAEPETIRVVCRNPDDGYGDIQKGNYTPNASDFQLISSMKSYGDDGKYSPFVSQWEKDDALIQEYAGEWSVWTETYYNVSVRDRSIFHTRVMARMWVGDEAHLCSESDHMYYGYVAEFSPLLLAWEQMLGNGTVFILLLLFVAAGAFLNVTYHYTHQRELRGYRDEIARQKQALEYAKGAEQSRREMTSAIAHELKTPIAVLSSYAEALQENIDADKQAHYLSVIREETDKMDRMVLELLDLSRLEAGKYKLRRESFDLEELAREILVPLEPQIQSKNLVIQWQVGEPMVEADRYRMGQVIENFMTNAIRHTPRDGKIVIRIGTDEETVSVENQGKQIPQEQLSKVWETFWQGDASRNERGSGLGLAICRTIVSLHGGTCKAENTPAGVRFSVSLSEEKKLYQQGRMPREQVTQLDFPIAQWYTTVESVMNRLGLMKKQMLLREIQAGHIRIGSELVTDKKQKLYPGYILLWREYRITIRQDDDEKRRILLMERMRPGGLGNPDHAKSMGYLPGR